MKRERAMVSKIIDTRQAKRVASAASNAQAAARIEAHKARMREAENAGLMRTLARMVKRARAKPSAE
jgi:hypothetical protein